LDIHNVKCIETLPAGNVQNYSAGLSAVTVDSVGEVSFLNESANHPAGRGLSGKRQIRTAPILSRPRVGGQHVLTHIALGLRAPYDFLVASHAYHPTEVELGLNGAAQTTLHERAAAVTRRQFGKKVFVRAVVEVSNFCRENCAYCGMRRDNHGLARYRAKYEQIAELLIHHRPASVTDINIQSGEDPVAVREVVLPLIETLRRETTLGISVCLGTLSSDLYSELQVAGARIYIMKFESGDAVHYEKLEAPSTLADRLRHIRLLSERNWFVSSGFIAGLPGQGLRELRNNLELARALPLHGCSVSPFIPGENTPLARE
jgi:biotin synthase